MILEAALLEVKQGQEQAFEQDFEQAGQYISAIPGYLTHSLRRCMEQSNKYLLLVEWTTLEDHTIGFRQSPQYQEWKRLLHHYYEPFPIVEHFEEIG
ncbi:MAG: antibiotic biosynthesis monooxygenase [Bacteroidota bacterium]